MRRPVAALATLLIVGIACGKPAGAPPAARIEPDWPLAGKAKVVVGQQAVVVAGNVLASEVGREVLRQGGNAVDAAVAVGFAMAVVDPEAGNIGGGGFMLIRRAGGDAYLLDYREQAPGRASRDMYLDADEAKASSLSTVGHLAPGVPGSVAGLVEAHRRFGQLPLERLIDPAIHLARDGFRVDSIRSARIRGDSAKLARFPASARIFLPGGRVPAVGDLLVQSDLARTLAAIQSKGRDGFYHGWVADSIVAEMERGGGLISHRDLAGYAAYWREPTRINYRGYTVLGAPPASCGGIVLGAMLNMIQAGGPTPSFGSTAALHLYGEAMRRGFILRNRYLADPAFTEIPRAWLLSRELGDSLRGTIDMARTTPTPALTTPGTGSTTHYSVVDAEGNAVATTTTINDLYGSGVTVSGAGFLLNDEMDDFNTAPDRANSWGLVGGAPNMVEPGKRPLSNMTPTIVLDQDGQVRLLLGSRGGATIPTQVLQVVVNVLDQGMGLPEAMAAPRVHHQGLPDVLRVDRGGFSPAVLDSLRAMGHTIRESAPGGDVEAILRTADGWVGVSDPRSGGGGAAY